MNYKTVLVEKREGLGIIPLNRPEKLNAMNLTLSLELDQTVSRLEDDDEVKAIIITGSGNKAFSAGGDIKEMADQSQKQLKERGTDRADRYWHLAKELLLTGREVEAEEALRIGLLNKLVPSSHLMQTSLEMASAIAKNNPDTVQAIKMMLNENIGLSWRDMMINEATIRT